MKCISIFKCKPQIEVIDKSHCNLEDVPNFQSYSRSLEELFLDANKLTLLNDNVFRLTKLRRFSFSDNAIEDIPPDIAKLVNLVELDCSRNRIQIIPEQIKFLRGLQVGDFSGNDIEYLPTGLVQLKNLTFLTLNYCLIKNLPEDIGLLKNLESLELRENEIESLPSSITGLESLKKLDLGRNLISKLPDDIGNMKNLEYLLLDANRLTTIPPKIGRLENLQCLDLSKQELYGFRHLPEEISGLISLTDLHLSENHLTSLPNGIKELQNLTILKADGNILSDLNPNIGGCVSLQELVLTSNEISHLPPTIGNLVDLRSLNVDDNMLTELPEQIGNLKQLGILSLRDNLLSYLPNEIGQLESAKVIDFSGNRIEYLPISITALNLNALWLSKNQAQPLPKLQIDELPNGTRVLTCYLLPQQSETGDINETGKDIDVNNLLSQQDSQHHLNRPTAVSFDATALDDSEAHMNDVNFVRHDTPHPRELRARHQKLFGNVASNNPNDELDNHQNGHELKGHDNEGFNLASIDQRKNYDYDSNGLPEVPDHTMEQYRSSTPTTRYNPEDHKVDPSQPNGHNTDDCYVMDIRVRRSKNHKPGLGLSIAGGKDTPPFKDNDEGIFVSKVTQGGPAEAAGVRVGDKILAVNNNEFYDGITHHEAVNVFRGLKSDCNEFTIRILRDPMDEKIMENQQVEEDYEPQAMPMKLVSPTKPTPLSKPVELNNNRGNNKDSFSRNYTIPIQSEDDDYNRRNNRGSNNHTNSKNSLTSSTNQEKAVRGNEISSRSSILDGSVNKNIIYTTLVKDYKHDLGIELENRAEDGIWSNIVIADILPNSIASMDGKLQVDDRLLSINGTDVTGVDLERIKSMLNGTDRFIRVVVSRGDMNDPIGAALRNVPLKQNLGSWFSSTTNMANRPSLIESYQRPTFGSVTNLQNNNNNTTMNTSNTSNNSANNNNNNHHHGTNSATKPPKPPKPTHLLARDDCMQSPTSPSSGPKADNQYDTSLDGPRPAQRAPNIGGTDDSGDTALCDIEKRAVWRRERLKSIEDDVEMAKIIAEAHRRRNEERK